jgi:hypothetical protein
MISPGNQYCHALLRPRTWLAEVKLLEEHGGEHCADERAAARETPIPPKTTAVSRVSATPCRAM